MNSVFCGLKMCNIAKIICSAEKTIDLVDDSVDEKTLEVLGCKKQEVQVRIYSRNAKSFNLKNVKRRNIFKSGFQYTVTSEFSDRYLLIDEKHLYVLSGPLKRNGKRGYFAVRIIGYSEVSQVRSRMGIAKERKKRYMV